MRWTEVPEPVFLGRVWPPFPSLLQQVWSGFGIGPRGMVWDGCSMGERQRQKEPVGSIKARGLCRKLNLALERPDAHSQMESAREEAERRDWELIKVEAAPRYPERMRGNCPDLSGVFHDGKGKGVSDSSEDWNWVRQSSTFLPPKFFV